MEHSQSNETEYNECIVHGICSISPSLSYIQEIILIYLETLAFYLFEMEMLGLSNKKIRQDVMDVFSALTANVEYNQDSLDDLISTLYENLFQAKEMYNIVCKEKNITPKYLKSSMKISKQFTIADVLKQGQKTLIKKNQTINDDQKKMLDILIIILKSICLHIVELQELNVNIDEAYRELLSTLNAMNFSETIIENLDGIMNESAKLHNELMQKIFDARKAEFGEFTVSEVSYSTRLGKAILVAGINMKELELILKATEGKGIDVYTHGQMVLGHSFPKLKAYPHLAGYYGKGVEYCTSDFSSFPGAIYLTKLSLYHLGHLYHSSIFTSDKIAPIGIITIKDNNFEPLINAALSAEGFTEPEPQKIVKLGVIEEEFIRKVHMLTDMIEAKKIKHVIAIGRGDGTESQKKYFEKFLDLIGDDCFVFSGTYTNNSENIVLLNMDYLFPFAYKAMNIFMQRKVYDDLNIAILLTRYEPHTMAHLVSMRNIGVKHLYFGSCPPNLVNPTLMKSLMEKLNIKHIDNPEEDIKTIFGKKD
jgi:hydroxylamine reductase